VNPGTVTVESPFATLGDDPDFTVADVPRIASNASFFI